MTGSGGSGNNLPVVNSKRKRATNESANGVDKSWREILGPPPPMGKPGVEREVWIRYHKKKWEIQLKQKKQNNALGWRRVKPRIRFLLDQSSPASVQMGQCARTRKKRQKS